MLPLVEALCRRTPTWPRSAWSATGSSTRPTSVSRDGPPVLADGPMGAAVAAAAAAPRSMGTSSPSTCAAARSRRRTSPPRCPRRSSNQSRRVWLEQWAPSSASCVWRFNVLYWQDLVDWEKVTGKEYEQALPGGETDARNTAAAREIILELFRIWDELASRRALPDQLDVLELGVGNGGQARMWLDEFVELDRRHGRDYYRRLHYLMGDYSAHVLDRARAAVAHHGDHVSGLVLEATRPSGPSASWRARRSSSTSRTSTTICQATRWPPSAAASTWWRPGRSCPARRPTRSRSGSGSAGPSSPRSPSDCCGSARSCWPSRCRRSSPTPGARCCSGRRSGRRSGRPSGTSRSRASTPTGSRRR